VPGLNAPAQKQLRGLISRQVCVAKCAVIFDQESGSNRPRLADALAIEAVRRSLLEPGLGR